MRLTSFLTLPALLFCMLLIGCAQSDYSLEDQAEESLTKISVDRAYFRDEAGRYLTLHGVNLGTKQPVAYDPVSYTNMPFPLDQADKHFTQISQAGFNVVRLLVYWEGIEPYGKGQYDTAYLDYLEQVVAAAQRHGIYVLMDMHQDMFSRHLLVYTNDGTGQNWLDDPVEAAIATTYGYNNKVAGDGAPEWVVQLSLPEKNVGGPDWGLPFKHASGLRETSNVLPWTSWFLNMGTSIDINRCFAALFAGDKIMPNYFIEGQNLKDYLQEAYANSFAEVARRVGKYDNVIGYDIINEPGGIYIAMTIWALLFQSVDLAGGNLPDDKALEVMDGYLDSLVENGLPRADAEYVREIYLDYDLLPTNAQQIKEAWPSFEDQTSPLYVDFGEVFNLNSSFNRDYLQPFFERVGAAILAEDPSAVIFLEQVKGLPDRGIAGQWATPMTPPAGIPQYVYAPHWYTDIYPHIGFFQPPRDFTVGEIRFRDYLTPIQEAIDQSTYSLNNPPVVMAEFGSYYNYGGIEKSIETNYLISEHILDPYYEVYEELLLHRILWCYSIDNTAYDGERWNKEDFSILDFDGNLRAQRAYTRPYARFAAGRPLETHFYSDLHYYDPVPGVPTPVHEFYFRMGGREGKKATEIFVPRLQYPDGFYVYLSGGWCAYDSELQLLYWYLDDDNPQAEHEIRFRPSYDDYGDNTWDYFFDDEIVRENGRHGG